MKQTGNKQTGKTPPARQAWSDYWDRHAAAGAHQVGGPQHAGLFESFWQKNLSIEFAMRSHVRMLDAACGDGAVARLGVKLADEADDCTADIHATDYSHAALMALGQSEGAASIQLVAADARSLPYSGGAFDVVTSQCGLEYAGQAAFASVAGLLAPQGRMLAIIHCTDGVIFRECAANLAILDRLDRSDVIAACGRLFDLQRQFLSGRVVARLVGQAAGKLALALSRVDADVRECAVGAARSHVLRLLADLERLRARHAAYAADTAKDWLRAQTGELAAFRQRMRSMMDAAADQAEIADIGAGLDTAGLSAVDFGEIRQDDAALPLAWTLSATAA